MAEQVQAILERMVPYLKDLRNRNLFTSEEIRLIVERRRRSEYLLQRRSQAQMSDYLRYIEDEIQLERLRKLRKEKVLTELENEERGKKRRMWMSRTSDDGDGHNKKNATSYQTSGPGDAHIISHIHFLYQRTLKKFHYPLDVLLNYAEFSKEVKSFHMLSRVYAMGMQHHPREAGLWIEAASFEYFGYVAQDYESKEKEDNSSSDRKDVGGEGGVNSKVVGSSIKKARVLMQRGLRINKTSTELWLQYFALELHYVQKLRGRKEVLESLEALTNPDDNNKDEKEVEADRIAVIQTGYVEESEQLGIPTSLLPCQVIFKNAILAIPNDVQFRLRFVEACRMFPGTSRLEAVIMRSITQDFGTSVEGWVARISYAEEQMKNKKKIVKNKDVEEFLSKNFDDGDVHGDIIDRPMKKSRIDNSSRDVAVELLKQALEAAPSSNLYVEGARFLRMRIQCLLEYANSSNEGSTDDDFSYLIFDGEDATAAAQRLTSLLEELHESAKTKNVLSTTLTLDFVDFLLSVEQPIKAEQLLSSTIESLQDVDVRLWLRWADISRQLEGSLPTSSSPTRILRRALKRTPLHDGYAHTLILTELMQQLMTQQSSKKTNQELKSLFQQLILLSQGLSYSPDDSASAYDEFERSLNVASTVLSYFNYSILSYNNSGDENSVRSIYTSLIYHSNYGKSFLGKTQDELLAMKSLFDSCIRFEKEYGSAGAASINAQKKHRKDEQKARKIRLNKLYTAAIGFYSSGICNIKWRNVVNSFQRDLDDIKCGL